jgi:hypothetical protein
MAAAALADGWAPAALAAFVGANTAGVRSPTAVLAARLSPGELPAPPDRARGRPPWCGDIHCHERTRRLTRAAGDDPAADAGRCPRCHPLAVTDAAEERLISPTTDAGLYDTGVSGPGFLLQALEARAPQPAAAR